MRVIGCDPRPVELPGVERLPFERVLAEADVLSLHLHLAPDTEGLIGRDALARMKPGAILINTSRGGIVDEAVLIEALNSGRLGGAGLDVIDGEWMDEAARRHHPLLVHARAHDNLVVTPHIGGATVESITGARLFIAREVAAFLTGRH
jgi:phosphoglycerate dehydrogenase-like enzyme